MKRKRVYAHRTLKMREDFLHWLSKKSARQQEAEQQLTQADRAPSPAFTAPADDGSRES